MRTNWIDNSKKQPEKSGEYLVTYDLNDNDYPLTTSMDWDSINKHWSDPRGTGDPVYSVLYWMNMPKAKQGIPREIWCKD